MFVSNEFSILPEITLKKEFFLSNHPVGFIHLAKTGGANVSYLLKTILHQKGLSF